MPVKAEYIYVGLVVAGTVAQLCLTKLYQARMVGQSMKAFESAERVFFLGMALSASAWLILMGSNGFRIETTRFSALCALATSVGGTLTNLFGIMVLSRGRLSVYTLFLMLGGMSLPFLAGVAFWGEPLIAPRLAGLLLLAAALAHPAFEKTEGGGSVGPNGWAVFLLLCFGVFAANGMNGIVAKIHQTHAARADTVSFMILRETFNAPFNAALFLILFRMNRKNGSGAAASPAEKPYRSGLTLLIIFIFAAAYCGSHFFNLLAARTLDASWQFPVVTGGALVLSAAAGRLFFHEKLSKRAATGIAAAAAATVLFGLGESIR